MLHYYQPVAKSFFRADLQLETWADDCLFTEGPFWHPDGYYLFSDIEANCIYRIDGPGRKHMYLENSGTDHPEDPDLKPEQVGSNGLALDHEGSLLVCRHGAHELARYRDGNWVPVINRYDGRPLNSPNDLILHNDGRIFFSDPPYGLKEGKLAPEKFQPRAGVYVWDGRDVKLVSDRYQYPNGVCLSPDEAKLYIVSNKNFEATISIYDTDSYRYLGELARENSDGIEVDAQGNFYLCTREGLVVLDPEGQRLAKLELPAVPANCCWGGPQGRDLLITARQYVYVLKNFQISDV